MLEQCLRTTSHNKMSEKFIRERVIVCNIYERGKDILHCS